MPRSMLYCLRCGGSFPIRRQNNRKRERNHIKTMWCPWCKRVTPHRENRADAQAGGLLSRQVPRSHAAPGVPRGVPGVQEVA